MTAPAAPHRWLPRLALLGAVLALVAALARDPWLLRGAGSPPVDALPLYLGAKAWLAGQDPNDPAVLEALFHQDPDVWFHVNGFHSYYPPTASLLLVPLAWLSLAGLAALFHWGGLLALLGTAGFSASAGRSRGRLAWMAGLAAVGAIFLQLRVTRVVLQAGQVSPFVVLAAAIALWGLSRSRSAAGLAAFTLGALTKFLPLLLLPVALASRRWRWILAALGVGLAFALCAWCWRDGAGGWRPVWLFGASRFVLDRPMQPWAHRGPAFLTWLFQARLPVLGPLSLALVGLAAWRRPGPELCAASGALMLAWGGALMAGGNHYHESLVILPALGFVLGWPAVRGPWKLQWLTAATALGALVLFGAFDHRPGPSPPHWLPLSAITWALCALRWGWAWRQEAANPAQPRKR